MRRYSAEETKKLKGLRASGKPYSEIAKELGRTLDSVEQKCIRLMRADNTLVSRNRPKDTKKYDLESDLARMALMLWWAEGTKGGKSVQFVNTSPEMISVYMLFLSQIGVDMQRVKAKVTVMATSQVEDTQNYWSRLTGIPPENFTKPIVRGKEASNPEHRGCLTITYSSVNLKKQMEDKLAEIRNELLKGHVNSTGLFEQS